MFIIQAAANACTMHAATLQCTHTHTLTTRAHILGANEALGGCAHLKNISPTAWLFLWLFVHELMHRTDTIHSGHRQATRSQRSLALFVLFAASPHSDICVCPSPQSAKHRDLLKHSCFQEQTTNAWLFRPVLITACSIRPTDRTR